MMGDLLAGTTVRALDTPPTVSDTENDAFNFTITTYGVATTAGVYNDCGVAFTAPTTGRVKISYASGLDNNGANSTSVTPVVRTGSTVGSGTTVVAADIANSVLNIGTDERRYGASIMVSGLTAGSSYNVRLEHRASGGTGTAEWRNVIVEPCT